jgi:Protein of unknown function with PCYCGC motif
MRITRRPAALALPRLPILLFALLTVAFALPSCAQAQPGGHVHATPGRKAPPKAKNHHPDARPGITAANVLSGEVVPSRAREPYTIAARIPGILDALYCHCDCHERDGRRSLLECFEDDMASTCGICQGQARQAGEMHAAGKTLAEIRAALDQRWGS